MWPGGGQDQEVGFELLGKSQPHDVRKKGVSGRGTGKGKNPEVGRSWCVGGTEMRQGPKRLGDIRMGGKMGSLAGGHGGSRRESAWAKLGRDPSFLSPSPAALRP